MKQSEDIQTQSLPLETEDKQLLAAALETHAKTVARKASADAPPGIKQLWQAELKKIEDLARKVLK